MHHMGCMASPEPYMVHGKPSPLPARSAPAEAAAGSGSAPASGSESPPARREGVLPRREGLWPGEGRIIGKISNMFGVKIQSSRWDFCFVLFAPGDESPGHCHRCPLMGHQNRFKLALMPLEGEGEGGRNVVFGC